MGRLEDKTTVCASYNHNQCADPDCGCDCHKRTREIAPPMTEAEALNYALDVLNCQQGVTPTPERADAIDTIQRRLEGIEGSL